MPREIVSPRVIKVIVQEDGWKQAQLERGAWQEALDDLPRAEVLLVGVGTNEVEVKLIGEGLGEEVAAAGKGFQVEELVLDQAVDGFHVALKGVGGRWDTDMLTIA
jgi:hypothetical protein